jgi:hypothetical protein
MDGEMPAAPRMRDRVAPSVWATLDELAVVFVIQPHGVSDTSICAVPKDRTPRQCETQALSRLWSLLRSWPRRGSSMIR